jgi:hypothetical protein
MLLLGVSVLNLGMTMNDYNMKEDAENTVLFSLFKMQFASFNKGQDSKINKLIGKTEKELFKLRVKRDQTDA